MRCRTSGQLTTKSISIKGTGCKFGGCMRKVLDKLDQELERRGYKFARYADDCNIYVCSRRAGERVMAGIMRFITAKLRLKVNSEKSAVARPWERKFLGFSFTNAGVPKRRIAPKAVDRFQERVRELTCRTRGISMERMAEELTRYLRGWIGHFGKCQTPSVLQSLDTWVRRRLRSAIWKQWKRSSVRFCRASPTRSARRLGRADRGQRPWPLANLQFTGACIRTAQCLFRLARDSEIDWPA